MPEASAGPMTASCTTTSARTRVGDREWVFDHPFFIIVNLALGGTFGGNIALDLEFPIRYYVDYVRFYGRGAP